MRAELRDWDLWGPFFLCMSLAVMLSMKAHDQASIVFSVIFVIVWVGAAIITINGQLLGGKLCVILKLKLRFVHLLRYKSHSTPCSYHKSCHVCLCSPPDHSFRAFACSATASFLFCLAPLLAGQSIRLSKMISLLYFASSLW